MSIFDIPISTYKNVFSPDPEGIVPMGEFLNPSPQVRDAIMVVRQATEKKVRDKLKKQLPAATTCGTFSKRSIDGVIQYNGTICLDFDQAENPGWTPDDIKEHLAAIPEVSYAATSCSGLGVFALIQTNNQTPLLHGRIVDFLRMVFQQDGLKIDIACKDVSRLRSASFDENPLINPMPVVYDAVAYIERQNQQATQRRPAPDQTTDVTKRVEKYVELIEGRRVDITDSYERWFHIGLALAAEFGASGETIFQRVSQFHPKYDPLATTKKYQELCRSGRGRVRIATFFKICHENNIRP